jgi:exodeoxyribonuclease V gamma subunit
LIQIYSSQDLRYLADQCAEKMDSFGIDDPFIPQSILVPNLDTARWLRLRLTEKNEITANIEFFLPAEWQWKQVRKLYPGLPKTLASDRGPLKWALYDILSDDRTNRKFPVLHRYITTQKEISRENAVYQLSGKLASLFDEYILYRPEMMNRWESGFVGKGDEMWQAELWRTLNSHWKTNLQSELPQNRAQLFIETEKALQRGEIRPEPSLSVFNTGLMPATILRSLQHSGERSDLSFFIVQPSSSVQNPRNRIVLSYGEDAHNIAELYESLNRAKREQNFDTHEQKNLLGNIQKSIIFDDDHPKSGLEEDLSSVQIRSCHSPLREIETLHEFLLEQFECDDSLAPDDVAVVTPNPDSYKTYIDAVFNHQEENLPVIPYHLGSDRKGSSAGKTLIRLLDLLDSRFEFENVMDFFQSEIVRNRFGLSESQTASVRQWMQDNHVVWGFDGEHRSEWDQPRSINQTWKSALDRGWLGQWVGENDDDDSLYYHRIESGEQKEVWAAFSTFIHTLNDAGKVVKQKKTLSEWATWLREIESSFIQKKFDEEGSFGRPLQRLLDAFLEQVSASSSTLKVPFRVIRSEVEQLTNKPGASGAVFTRGVTFSSMVPLRSMPFKVIALIGLNDQEFPRKSVTPDFDLMARNPQPGERNRKFEDRNLFLESIMSAQNVHYCSFTGQSPEDNETIPPSTIVSEWAAIIAEICGKKRDEIIQKEPLTGFSPSSFIDKPAFSGRYFNTLQKMMGGKSVSGLVSASPVSLTGNENVLGVGDLARFFKNPMQYFINVRFGNTIREDDAEKGEFTLDPLETHLLFQQVFGWVLANEDKEIIQKRLKLSGVVTDGWPGEKLIDETVTGCLKSIAILEQQQITPGFYHRELSVTCEGVDIQGDLMSYSGDRLVDVSLSKPAGRIHIQTWIRHIIWNVAVKPQESYLICNVKEGAPSLVCFSVPEQPELLLSDLLTLYKIGLTEPITFFPDTLSEYLEGNTEDRRIEKATNAFEGAFKKRGERENQAIQILMGPEAPFNELFLKPEYVSLIKEMKKHKKEVKL